MEATTHTGGLYVRKSECLNVQCVGSNRRKNYPRPNVWLIFLHRNIACTSSNGATRTL